MRLARLCHAAALCALALLTGCAGPPELPEQPPRDLAIVDIVGADELLDAKDQKEPLPSLVEVWAQAAGIDPRDRRLIYTFTENSGGMALFCRLRAPLTDEELEHDEARLPNDNPVRVTIAYARANLPYLYDASLALLTRRPTAAEAAGCAQSQIGYTELTLGTTLCQGRPCPVVLLVKHDRLATPLLRQLVETVAREPGLLGDTTALILAGVTAASAAEADRTRAAAAALLKRPTREPS